MKEIYRHLLILAGVFVLFAAVTMLQVDMKIDEFYNHLPTLQNIYNGGLNTLSAPDKYLAANTPLPYFILSAPARLLNLEPSIVYARLLTSAFSFISIILVYLYFKKTQSSLPLVKTLIILFLPYFLKPSFTFYIAVYGLLFFIILLLHIKTSQKVNLLLAGFISAAAIMSQQFYLALLPAMFVKIFNPLSAVFDSYNQKLRDTVLYILPALLFLLPLFLIWGGLTTPHYSFHQVGFDPTKVPVIFISAGVYTFPFLFSKAVKRRLKEIIPVSIISVIVVALFYPEWGEKGGWGQITGISFHLLNKIESFNYFSSFLIKTVLCGTGILILLQVYQSMIKDGIEFLGISILCFSAGFMFNVLLAERHLLPLIVGMYIYFLNKIDNKLLLRVWVGIAAAGGTSYYLYYLFIQKSF